MHITCNMCMHVAAPGWNYGTPPICRKLKTAEVVTKGANTIYFDTIVMETRRIGWTCKDATDAANRAVCAGYGGTVDEAKDMQCECVAQQSVYPLAVEEMELALEISYQTSVRFGAYSGSTNVPNGTFDEAMRLRPLHARVIDQDGVNVPPRATRSSARVLAASSAERTHTH